MAMANFDTFHLQNHPKIIDAGIDSLAVIDKDGDPNLVIDVDTPFDIEVKWHVSGLFGYALNGCIWAVNVTAESMGPGDEVTLASDSNIIHVSTGFNTALTKKFTNVKPVNPATGGLLNGTYKLTVVITCRNSAGVPLHLAGFVEGPLVQFYTAEM